MFKTCADCINCVPPRSSLEREYWCNQALKDCYAARELGEPCGPNGYLWHKKPDGVTPIRRTA